MAGSGALEFQKNPKEGLMIRGCSMVFDTSS
jgi:hypothetical protein